MCHILISTLNFMMARNSNQLIPVFTVGTSPIHEPSWKCNVQMYTRSGVVPRVHTITDKHFSVFY